MMHVEQCQDQGYVTRLGIKRGDVRRLEKA